MCIIALKPAGAVIPEKTLKAMWDNNDDGAGLMFADNGRVRIVKGLMTFESFLEAYNRVGNHRKIVMHFRIRTHGAISPRLTHPFWIVKGEMGMVHNGIISGLGTAAHGDEESDTSLYAKILAHRYPDPLEALTNPEEHKKIEGEIGWSKLVFLTGDGDHMIINEKSGQWDNGCWFSNGSFRDSYKKWSYTGSYYGYTWDEEGDRPLYRVTGQPSPSSTPNLESWKDDTKPNLPVFQPSTQSAGELARRQASYDAEWEAMVARYEAKYGSAED